MKLKYLLPAATIASVATIVTPLVTSCSKKETAKYEWKEGGGNYKPLTPKKAYEFKTQTLLGDAYHKAISKNHFIWADDMVNWLGSESDRDHAQYGIEKLTYKLTKVGKKETLAGYASYTAFRISFKMTLSASIKVSGLEFVFDKRNAVASSVPVYVLYNNDKVKILLADSVMLTDEKWSINMPEIVDIGSGVPGLGDNNKTYNRSNVPSGAGVLTAFETLVEYMTSIGNSNYYSKQTVEA